MTSADSFNTNFGGCGLCQAGGGVGGGGGGGEEILGIPGESLGGFWPILGRILTSYHLRKRARPFFISSHLQLDRLGDHHLPLCHPPW